VVTEYAARGSLAAAIGGRPYPVREALRLVGELAGLVGYLHRQGVVHGNLKPTNVLLAADGIPRVTDFRPTGGLFQAQLPDDGEGAGVGYLAPEFVRDPRAEPRPHTDVYGLGLVLYEMLTGRPAVAGATAGETRDRVLSADPDPPSRLNPDVTPALDAVCLRCLRKDPWRRFARAYDLLTRLRKLADDPDGRGIPTRRPDRPT
jgi:serine/threonine protein kinase